MKTAAFTLHYATTPRKNDEGPRFRQTFAKFRHQFRLAKGPGTFARHTENMILALEAANIS